MNLVKTENGYRFYIGTDENNGKPVYNIVNLSTEEPTGGYYDREYIEKMKYVKFDKQ